MLMLFLFSIFTHLTVLSHDTVVSSKPITLGEAVRFVIDQRLLTWTPFIPGLCEVRECHLGFLQTDLNHVVGYEKTFKINTHFNAGNKFKDAIEGYPNPLVPKADSFTVTSYQTS